MRSVREGALCALCLSVLCVCVRLVVYFTCSNKMALQMAKMCIRGSEAKKQWEARRECSKNNGNHTQAHTHWGIMLAIVSFLFKSAPLLLFSSCFAAEFTAEKRWFASCFCCCCCKQICPDSIVFTFCANMLFLFILNRLSFVLNLFSEENCKSDLDPLRVVGVGLLPYHCLRVSAKLLNENIQKAAVMSIFKVKK